MVRFLATALCFLACGPAYGVSRSGPDREVVETLGAADTMERQTQQVVTALDHMLQLACWQARRAGRPDVADQICGDWERRFKPYMLNVMAEGLGDHEPLSDWLAIACDTLQVTLGDFTYVALHLDDLEIMNFGIPVMFDPHTSADWCREPPDTDCGDEYVEHTAPVIGVTSYWLAYWGCTAGTMGSGLFLFCTPVGMLTESLVMIRIAPGIAERVWSRNNPSNVINRATTRPD